MSKKTIFLILFTFFVAEYTALGKEILLEPLKDTITEPSSAEKTKVELYFRGGFVSDKHTIERNSSSHFQIDNARLNVQGDYNKDLSYRVRFRLNRPFSPTSEDNASAALDYAFLTYRFGKNRQWQTTIGKQLSVMGSFEKDINPLYEYIFTDYLNGVYTNVFLSGAQLAYSLNDRQEIGVQVHNTLNNSFNTHLQTNGFVAHTFTPSKLPLGVYFYWNGSFFEGKFRTKYSYNISQFADKYYTHSVSLGNKYKSGAHTVYLDLIYSLMGADFGLTSSRLLSIYDGFSQGGYTMHKNIVYKGAVSRYDYQLTDHWSLTAKLGVEQTGSQNTLNEHLRTNYIYFLAGQYAPFTTQDLRFYLAYVGNRIEYAKELQMPYEQLHRVAVGAYYTLPVLTVKTPRLK